MLNGQYNFLEEEKKQLDNNMTTINFDASAPRLDRSKIWVLVCPPPNAYDRPHMSELPERVLFKCQQKVWL